MMIRSQRLNQLLVSLSLWSLKKLKFSLNLNRKRRVYFLKITIKISLLRNK